MLSNLASSLILNEYIVTTKTKAKSCRSFVDKVLSKSKVGTPHSQKTIEKLLRDKLAVHKVIYVLADRFKDRSGSFVNMVALGHRKGDDASMVKLFLVGSKPFRKVKKIKKKKKQIRKKKEDRAVKKDRKKGVFDRMKKFRGRLAGRVKQEKLKDKESGARGLEEGGKKSRSGI